MKFKEYRDAIASLEEWVGLNSLSKFSLKYQLSSLLLHCTYHTEEQESLLPAPRTTDVPSCLKVIDMWASDREMTLALIHKFEGKASSVQYAFISITLLNFFF